MTNSVYYFSHDSNARNDEKILMLRAEHGWEGYGLYWALVEMMFESSETNLSHSKIKGIATGLNVTSEKLNEVIGYSIEEGLFQSDGNVFWSNSLCKRKEKFREISAIRAEAGQRGGQVRAERLKRAQEKGIHTKEEWEEMVQFFDYRCVSCNCDIQDNDPVKDHIKPIHKGGSDAIANIQPLCKSCNSGKSQDETDHRLNYCQANAKQMPSKWLANSSKVKERKEIKEKSSNRDASDADFQNIINTFDNNMGHLITPTESQKIKHWLNDGLEPEVIIWAIDQSVLNAKRTMNYIEAILRDLHKNNITTMAGVEARERNRKSRSPTPEDKPPSSWNYNLPGKENPGG